MPLPNTLKGDGVEILEVGGVRAAPQRSLNIGEVRVIGFALRPLVPTGFLFADGNEWIAAAETSVVGSFHIRSDVEVRERRAIIAASAALLLRESVGTPDEG